MGRTRMAMWRRATLAFAALTLLLGAESRPAAAADQEKTVSCTEYCGKKAAERCEDIQSLRCLWYMAGCLAGCKIALL